MNNDTTSTARPIRVRDRRSHEESVVLTLLVCACIVMAVVLVVLMSWRAFSDWSARAACVEAGGVGVTTSPGKTICLRPEALYQTIDD